MGGPEGALGLADADVRQPRNDLRVEPGPGPPADDGLGEKLVQVRLAHGQRPRPRLQPLLLLLARQAAVGALALDAAHADDDVDVDGEPGQPPGPPLPHDRLHDGVARRVRRLPRVARSADDGAEAHEPV